MFVEINSKNGGDIYLKWKSDVFKPHFRDDRHVQTYRPSTPEWRQDHRIYVMLTIRTSFVGSGAVKAHPPADSNKWEMQGK